MADPRGLVKTYSEASEGEAERILAEVIGMGAAAVALLIEVLEDPNRYDDERERAAKALGKIGTPSIPALMESLKKWRTNCRKFACDAFVAMGPAAAEPLIDYIRAHARSSNDCDGPKSALCMIGEPVVEKLIRALKDGEPEVVSRAATCLGQIGDKRALRPLAETTVDAPKAARIMAIEALGSEIADPESIPHLLRIAGDRDDEVREMVVWSMSGLALRLKRDVPPETLRPFKAPLLAALADRSPGVRREALVGLGHLGDPSTVDAIRRCLRDRDEEVRENAEWALEQMGEE